MHEYFLELSKQSIMGKDGSVLGCMEVQTILVRPVIMDIPTMKRALSVKPTVHIRSTDTPME